MDNLSKLTETLPADSPSQQPNEDFKKRNRKSKSVRKTSAEKYRFHANDAWQRQRDIEMAQKYGYALPFLNVIPQKIDPPTMEVPINTSLVDKVVEETHEYATRTLKVVSDDYADDVRTLKTAAHLQIATKVHYSHKNNELEVPLGIDDVMNFVSKHFSQAIEPIAYFIDNIGSTQFEEQIIVPTVPEESVSRYPIPLPDENDCFNLNQVADCNAEDVVIPTGELDHNAMELQVVVPAENMLTLAADGLYDIDTKVLDARLMRPGSSDLVRYHRVGMTLDLLAQKYLSILNRYSRRVKGKIRDLGLKLAAGKLTQLVGSDATSDHLGVVDAWSMRKVDDATLCAGALLRLGLTHYHRKTAKYAIKRGMVSRSQAVGKMVALLG